MFLNLDPISDMLDAWLVGEVHDLHQQITDHRRENLEVEMSIGMHSGKKGIQFSPSLSKDRFEKMLQFLSEIADPPEKFEYTVDSFALPGAHHPQRSFRRIQMGEQSLIQEKVRLLQKDRPFCHSRLRVSKEVELSQQEFIQLCTEHYADGLQQALPEDTASWKGPLDQIRQGTFMPFERTRFFTRTSFKISMEGTYVAKADCSAVIVPEQTRPEYSVEIEWILPELLTAYKNGKIHELNGLLFAKLAPLFDFRETKLSLLTDQGHTTGRHSSSELPLNRALFIPNEQRPISLRMTDVCCLLKHQYAVTPKYDGVRVFVVFTEQGTFAVKRGANKRQMQQVDAMPMHLRLLSKDRYPGRIVLDAEWVGDTCFVFDVMEDGSKAHLQSLPHRVRFCAMLVEQWQAAASSSMISSRIHLEMKPVLFGNIECAMQQIRVMKESRKISTQTDGLILIPSKASYAETAPPLHFFDAERRQQGLERGHIAFKFKPVHQLTIDMLVDLSLNPPLLSADHHLYLLDYHDRRRHAVPIKRFFRPYPVRVKENAKATIERMLRREPPTSRVPELVPPGWVKEFNRYVHPDHPGGLMHIQIVEFALHLTADGGSIELVPERIRTQDKTTPNNVQVAKDNASIFIEMQKRLHNLRAHQLSTADEEMNGERVLVQEMRACLAAPKEPPKKEKKKAPTAKKGGRCAPVATKPAMVHESVLVDMFLSM